MADSETEPIRVVIHEKNCFIYSHRPISSPNQYFQINLGSQSLQLWNKGRRTSYRQNPACADAEHKQLESLA